MAQTLPNCYRVTFTWLRSGDDEVVQTFHLFVPPGEATFADAENVALETATWLKTSGNLWRAVMLSSLTIDKVVVYDMNPGSLVNAEEHVGEPGTKTGGGIPHQAAMVLTWVTPYRGRPYRGRTYIGPLSSSNMTMQGMIDASFRTSCANAAEALRDHFSGLGRPMMVASFTHQELTDVRGVRIDDSPDVQRRRQRVATDSTVLTW